MIYFDSDMSKSRNTVVCFDWKTVIYIYVCGKCRTQFMLPMEKSVTFTGACADEIIPNGSLAGLLTKRKKEELRIYWCSTRIPYYMPFVSFNSKTMDVSSGIWIPKLQKLDYKETITSRKLNNRANTLTNRRKTKRQAMVKKTLHNKPNIGQHWPGNTPGWTEVLRKSKQVLFH
jgi:hypothetical protein